jgi:hypothetical protein
MPALVLGPLLRYVGETCATFWVETDGPCEVAVLGTTQQTFRVAGHHYGLVRVNELEPGTEYAYEVTLDGGHVWPEPESELPPSRFRTISSDGSQAVEIAFGSCRVAVPSEPPYTLRKDDDERGREHDALRTLAVRMSNEPFECWPNLLLLLGDQVYADEVSPDTREFIRSRRDTTEPPGEIALGFEDYTFLYRESWGEPVIRWLLSTVPSAMIFDDHDVHDDWNTSAAWLKKIRATDWWDDHIIGALASYWIYQHVGNLSPGEQDEDGTLARVQEAEDAWPILAELATGADRERQESRWSFHRDLGRTRLVMIDSRAGRALEDGKRGMLDDDEWEWIERHCDGDFDHLLLATSVPWLLAPGMHYLEAWNEAVCDGAWGARAAELSEKLRQELDLEHWAAFRDSFERLAELQRAVGAGERGPSPASVVTLSGDVHHAYLSEVAYPRTAGVRSAIYQAVCSPMRNPLDARERRAIKGMMSKPVHAVTRALAHAAGVDDPPVRWRMIGDGPWFDNQVASLHIDGRRIDFDLQKAMPDGDRGARLENKLTHRLA